jgi:deoxyribonuclease V
VDVQFGVALAQCLAAIPQGRVATCGSIATALGDVRAARAVSTWLHEREVPGAHRVVRADGRPLTQSARSDLLRDGIVLVDGKVPRDRFTPRLPDIGLLTELRAEQIRLERHVTDVDDPGDLQTLGAVDVAYEGDRAYGAAVVCDADTLTPIEIATAVTDVEFPYIPTYLGFRETPAIVTAFRNLREKPSVLLVDGHGRLHPARFGLACSVGVQLDLPTIGIAKHRLVGRPRHPIGPVEGGIPLEHHDRIAGYAWRPPGVSRPLYISVGHRISLDRALAIVIRSTRGSLPEPMRIADRLSKVGKKKREE